MQCTVVKSIFSTQALEILENMSQDDPDLQEMIQIAWVNAKVAQLIYATKTQAGLTQQDLADLIGTQQTVIAQLENVPHNQHSQAVLQRITQVLNTTGGNYSSALGR